jgi:large subunit ribosomal protein L16
MALMPKRVKFRKSQKGVVKGEAHRGSTVSFGDFGLQALEPAWLSAANIEAARVACSQYVRGEGKLFIRVFPVKSVSAKPLEVRMGSGKGEPKYWCAVIKPGTILFEIGGLPKEAVVECFHRVAHKLPFRTRLVSRRQGF